jgi:hypothetical protein
MSPSTSGSKVIDCMAGVRSEKQTAHNSGEQEDYPD